MSKNEAELREKLDRASEQIGIGSLYTHYKQQEHTYEVKGLSIVESDESVVVRYKALYGLEIEFVRPFDEFIEQVEHQGELVPRFRRYSF